MKHPSEEDLILYHYAEAMNPDQIARHVEECEECRAAWQSIQKALGAADSAPVPERGDNYGAEVWRNIEGRIELAGAGEGNRWTNLREKIVASIRTPRLAWGLAMAAVAIVAFLAGRLGQPSSRREFAATAKPSTSRGARERILIAEIGEHLERSQMALIELVNDRTNGPVDISLEKELARQLVGVNRLYRQTASRLGDLAVTSMLDDLERALIEISNSPAAMSASEFAEFRQRIDSAGVLFKVRVFASHLRDAAARAARQMGG
jgi:hypothetical protein